MSRSRRGSGTWADRDRPEMEVIPASSQGHTHTRSYPFTAASGRGAGIHRYPVRTIRKFDKRGFRVLKKLCRTFMHTQRDEYLEHQARQLELLEEQQDDMFEFDEKIIELEGKLDDMQFA